MSRTTRQPARTVGFDDVNRVGVERQLRTNPRGYAQLFRTLGDIAANQEDDVVTLMLVADTEPSGDEEAPVVRLLRKFDGRLNRDFVDLSQPPTGVRLRNWRPEYGPNSAVMPEFLPDGYDFCRSVGFVTVADGVISVGTVTAAEGDIKLLPLATIR